MQRVKWMRTRSVWAGDVLEVECFPVWDTQGLQAARAAARNVTGKWQQQINKRNSEKKLRRLLNANFGRKDLHVTLTYRRAVGHEQAKKDMQNFVRRIKRLRKRQGLEEMRYIYVLEWEDDPQKQQKRMHCHIVMSGGLDREAVEECWARGWANADRLQPGDEGLSALARYLTKSRKGARCWSGSRNLKQPVIRESNHRISRRRAMEAARELDQGGKEIMEKVYPGYQLVQMAVKYPSMEGVDGAYIYATMRRRGRDHA